MVSQLLGRLLEESTDVLVVDAEVLLLLFPFILLVILILDTEHVVLLLLLLSVVLAVLVVGDEILRLLGLPVESDLLLDL